VVLVPVIFSVCPHAHQAAEKVFETSILAAHGAAPQLGINKMHVNVARGHAPRWSFSAACHAWRFSGPHADRQGKNSGG